MQAGIRERQVPAVAGGLAVAGGVALWQLGIEFERAWLRSYEGPLLGELLPQSVGPPAVAPESSGSERLTGTLGERRRWVPGHHPRRLPYTRNGASS